MVSLNPVESLIFPIDVVKNMCRDDPLFNF